MEEKETFNLRNLCPICVVVSPRCESSVANFESLNIRLFLHLSIPICPPVPISPKISLVLWDAIHLSRSHFLMNTNCNQIVSTYLIFVVCLMLLYNIQL